MPRLRESTTAVIVRGERVGEGFASEPYEAGWASEAVIFLEGMDSGAPCSVRVQISPDGMHWADEGTILAVPERGAVSFGRISHFGNWLRLRAGDFPQGAERRVMATLHLKG
jgi:hypothetical protein